MRRTFGDILTNYRFQLFFCVSAAMMIITELYQWPFTPAPILVITIDWQHYQLIKFILTSAHGA